MKKCFLKEKLDMYCSGLYIPKDQNEEKSFLTNNMVKEFLNKKKKTINTGVLAEYMVHEFFKKKNIPYIKPKKLTCNNIKIKPDGYLPTYDVYIEIKSLGYFAKGTAPEKLDSIARKYSHIYNCFGKKVIVILTANAMFEKNGKEIYDAYKNNGTTYIKKLISVWKEISVKDIVCYSELDNYFV